MNDEDDSRFCGQVVLEDQVCLRGDVLRGHAQVPYAKGLGKQNLSLVVKCFVQSRKAESAPEKGPSNRFVRRRLTTAPTEKPSLSKVSPLFDPTSKTKTVELTERHRNGSIGKSAAKRRLNKISVVGRETTPEEDNLIINSMTKRVVSSVKEVFNTTILEAEFDMTEKLQYLLAVSTADNIVIPFELAMNNRLNCSFSRPISLTSRDADFNQKREEIIQSTVYRKAKTLNSQVKSTKVFDRELDPKEQETITVETLIQLWLGDNLLCSQEITVLDTPQYLTRETPKMIQGSIRSLERIFCCMNRRVEYKCVFSLSDNRISDNKVALAFMFKGQYGIMERFGYLDFKLQERVDRMGDCFSDRAIHGSSVHIVKKKENTAKSKLHEYFEIVNTINLLDFDATKHYSLITPTVRITHRVQVFLSPWPLTFRHLIGEVEVFLAKIARPDQLASQNLPDPSLLLSLSGVPLTLSL